MDSEFLNGFRSAIETGDFERFAAAYTADATFEGFLPGGIREATGPRAIAAQLARELGRSPTIAAWKPIRATTVDLEIVRGDPPERIRRIHKVKFVDGLIRRHWAYPVMLDTLLMGDSGARHRRVDRDDGSVVFEKLISPSHDWAMRVTRDAGREATLWHDGPLRDLPPSIDYPVISAERVGDGWLITTRDVSADLLDEPTIDQWRQVISCLDDLHERFEGRAPRGLCTLRDRLAILSEKMALDEIEGSDRYPKVILHGWREAPRMLPPDLRDRIMALARNPAPLISAFGGASTTLIHGDATGTNLGLRDRRLIALDWALATSAPAELEYTWLLGSTGALRDDVLDLTRAALGPRRDERRLRLALLYEFILELPQWAFWGTTCGPEDEPAAAADFAWWVGRAREGLSLLDA